MSIYDILRVYSIRQEIKSQIDKPRVYFIPQEN